MLCNAPTIAFRQPGINPVTGKHYPPVSFRQFSKFFNGSETLDYRVRILTDYYNSCPRGFEPVILPCKKCLLCTRRYRREWAYRLVGEASTCGDSMFLTLTVDDSNLVTLFPPRSGSSYPSLDHRPFQLFMKRLRKKMEQGFYYSFVPPFTPAKSIVHLPRNLETRFYQRNNIKYYMCGEYGDVTNRPHYHACIFGCRFPDAYFAKKVGNQAYFTSPTLKELWPYGEMSLFSDISSRSASYVAGYVDKKLVSDDSYYESRGVAPEYVRMSQGIGLEYFKRNYMDMYKLSSSGEYFGEYHFSGEVPVTAPKYFDEKLRLRDSDRFDKVVAARECRRLARIALVDVDETFNESGRKHAVMAARKPCREIREST